MIPNGDRKRRSHKRKPKPKRCPETGKIKFPTQREANEAVGRALLSTETARNERRSYKCERCGAWHLTSQAKRVPERDQNEYEGWT